MSKLKYIAEIPARLGSQRVKQKNLRLIEGEPMIAYAIKACKNANNISEVYVNTESDLIGRVALDYGVKYYKRSQELALDHIVSDQFNYDFLKKIECEALVMVNPVSPLVESSDIEEAIKFFEINQLDSMISVKDERLQSFYQGKPLNFDKEKLLPMTQDINPIQICVWTICIWRRESFIKAYEKNGYAVFNGKFALWPINPLKSIKISYEEDFILAEQLLKARKYCKKSEVKYYGE
ncbi:acylneuraminate cytidylyltransferase [Campylobacter lari]|nr:acylneuraminate cytidylyltransferase [Campylobacter lari]MPB47334.1 acylneuraminate cytidylyltransferase [Campylobacter lari]